MATDREQAFPVENFVGLDRQVDRENLSPRHFYNLQNLWERELGVMETRPGSEVLSDTFPSNVVDLNDTHRIYKNENDQQRIVTAKTTQDIQALTALPTGVSMAFASDASGTWLKSIATNVVNYPESVVLRFHGYGIDYYFRAPLDTITGYTGTPGNYRLDVTVPNDLDTNITGIEVYAIIKNGTIYNKVSDPNYNEMTMWAGRIELSQFPSGGTQSFLTCPLSRDSSIGGTPIQIQATNKTFNIESIDGAAEVGLFTAGTLVEGRTYFVSIMGNKLTIDTSAGGTRKSIYVTTIAPTPVTIGKGANCLKITSISPTNFSSLVAIGEDPQLLKPVGVVEGGLYYILNDPKGSPAVVDVDNSTTTPRYQFRHSDFSIRDMLINVKDDGTFDPVFCGRMHKNHNDSNLTQDYFVDASQDYWNGSSYIASNLGLAYFDLHSDGRAQYLGDGNNFDFADWNTYALGISDYDPRIQESSIEGSAAYAFDDVEHKSGSSYFITDGIACAIVAEDFQTGTPIRLPSARYITVFQESVLLTGGDPNLDPPTASLSNSDKIIFFSRTTNPFDFTVAGAASALHQFFQTELGGERNLGMSAYTNTTGTEGPISQLVISKRNGTWILTNLPIATGGALPQTFMTNLSGKVGGIHKTMVHTTIGLISASYENIYLIRHAGEPAPLGDSVSSILKEAQMETAVATFHDDQYKLSFYHPGFSGTPGFHNVELWLDINKMKAVKGVPSWKGPMVGRSINYTYVEDLEGYGPSYNTARTRIAVDRENIRVFKADVDSNPTDTQVLDFLNPVETILETKDMPISDADKNWNKLIKRQYWKVRTNKIEGDPLLATEETWIDGVKVEDKEVSFFGLPSTEFQAQPLKITNVFPTGRLRGRTLRKILKTSYRIAIGGFTTFYQIERRRI